ncbi:MAG: M14 family metallopeptidase [Lachnospiraceae bacterium]
MKIRLREHMTWDDKKRAIETSLFMGFETVSASFPIVSLNTGIEVKDLRELQELFPIAAKKLPKDYVSATKQAHPITDFDWRTKKGLETIFQEGYFLKDRNNDLLPDQLDFKIHLPKDSDLSLVTAACNFAFRFGMETTAYEGFLVAEEGYQGNLLVFESSQVCKMEWEERGPYLTIKVSGSGKELEEFSSYLCEHFPLQPNAKTWVDYLQQITDSYAMKNLDGQLTYLKAFEDTLSEPIKAYISPTDHERLKELKKYFPKVEFHNYKGMKKIYEKEYAIPWEVEVFKDQLEQAVYPNIQAGDTISVCGALSEDKAVRDALVKEVKQVFLEREVKVKDVQILCAYKQGLSWIEEIVIPKLAGKLIGSIEIYFQPFLPEGVDSWGDEDGATPSYDNTKADNPDKWYDLPIRFLQELYPVEDILAKQLHVDREHIRFAAYNGMDELTYEFRAFDRNNQEIFTANYLAAYSERPYLDAYPQLGKVHPNTGYIKVVKNGNTICNHHLETDIERIWNIYQEEILPDCKEFVEKKMNGKVHADKQPFFSQLRLEIVASEPNYRLESREDIISSLDALHEDLYFVGTDYFKNYGIQHMGEILDAPGLILPVIRAGIGKPVCKVTLFDQEAEQPCLVSGEHIVTSMAMREQIQVYIQKLSYHNHEMTAHIRVNSPCEKLVSSFTELLNQNVLGISSQLAGVHRMELNTHALGSKEGSYQALIKPWRETVKTLDIQEIDWKEYEVIGYEQYLDIIEQLKQVPGIQVYKIADSYAGRDIYAVELLPKVGGYLSRTKRITRFPSEIINARHHANEVSSTNAAFMLLKTLLTKKEYAQVPNKLNLVIVPMENVDGAAIHYELQKENPHWKFHVARFNAIGKEFYHEHFKPDTIHSEAQGFTWLWKRCLPDVVVDNHGVPSHEWEQPFSGYTSPSFKGFWLPRSLLYGYFWTVTGEEYMGNYTVNKKMEEVIADAIGKNEDIRSWNQEWMGRFEKYAHGFMPKLFPANYYKDMINYWIPFAYDAAHRYPSIRFPWITTVAYTSEVADETAQGEYLHLCANAHQTHDLAIIEMLMNSQCMMQEECRISDMEISVSCIRQRPIVV